MATEPGSLAGRRVLLGVTGSIAAYKAAEIASRLVTLGADVHTVLTDHASQFIGEATLRALTGNPVLRGVFDEPHDHRITHIHVAQTADVALVAPATANIIAKMACGIADDMLSTLVLATTAPIMVAPAMNTVMLAHAATQANLAALRARGVTIVDPAEGRLACGSEGAGRLADVEDIIGALCARLQPRRDLSGIRVLVTAGATREPIDPVRFISNRSSGRMGCAVVQAAVERGASVSLVSGHMSVDPPAGVATVRVSTTAEMLAACAECFEACDVFVAAAAPADYAPARVADHKVKKRDSASGCMVLELVETPDVLATLAARKDGQVVVGFAAETQDLCQNAERKLRDKGLDLIVANDVTADGAGFDTDTNIVTLLWPDGRVESLARMPKSQVGHKVLDAAVALLHRDQRSVQPGRSE